MATAAQIHLSVSNAGVYHVPNIKKSSAERASQVLQENHDKNHIHFNIDGFHNHVAHHILSLYALGATPEEIQKGYENNKGYQRGAGEKEDRIIEAMGDRQKFLKYLGKDDKYYVDFRDFFESELQTKGVEKTFQEQLFGGDEAANRMNDQMYSAFLHPIIHTGFGIEFAQPAVQAEGLAMCAVSSQYMTKYYDGIRQVIASEPDRKSHKSLFDLLSEIQSSDKLAHSARWEDGNKVRDGVIARAGKEMVEIASQWQVSDAKDLGKKTAEMSNFVAYMTAAAQNPKKEIKFDFFYMHCMNASLFFWSFLEQSWLTDEQKITLLEKKAWADLALYASRNSPKLYLDDIIEYKEKQPGNWDSLFKRVDRYEDDGHTAKFVRALANGQEKCKPYEEEGKWPIRGDMWLKIGHMVIDSVEAGGPRWVRSTGWPQAWEDVPDRSVASNGH